jgi:8-oxo-dGTP pyrophosphatase MutT (NUDIX family)
MPSWYRDPAAPEPDAPRRVGAVFIVELDGHVLVDRRADDGSWAFTGSAVAEGGTVSAAVVREFEEETGQRGATTSLGLFSDPTALIGYPDGTVVRIIDLAFIVTVSDGAKWRSSHESSGLRLFTRDELRDVDWWPIHRPIGDAYLAFDRTPVVA